MKLLSFLGAALAVAFLSASSAYAAVSPADFVTPDNILVVQSAANTDCLASFDPGAAIVYVEVNHGCDQVMAELTGLCLTEVPIDALPARIAAVFEPALDITCTTSRPAPPG